MSESDEGPTGNTVTHWINIEIVRPNSAVNPLKCIKLTIDLDTLGLSPDIPDDSKLDVIVHALATSIGIKVNG